MDKNRRPNAFVSGSKFADAGPSVEEARKAMLNSGQAPRGILGEARKNAEVGAEVQAAPPPVQRQTFTKARITVLNADGTDGDSSIAEAATPAELNTMIQKANAKATAARVKLKVEFLSDGEPAPVQADSAVPTQADSVVPAPAPTPVAIATPESEDNSERIENAKYVAEIKRMDDGTWIAEISFKNGAGIERFEAPSRKDLMRKLLEGKANATLRVRAAVRREKYGEELDEVYTLPDYVTQEGFDKMTQDQKQLVIDTLATQQAMLWHQQHPENYVTEENSIKIQKFLNKRNKPFTAKNLQYAYEELSEDGELETRPTTKTDVVTPSVSVAAPKPVDSAPVVPAPAPAPAAAPPVPLASQVRKRGSTGLLPSQSSSVDSELEPREEKPAKTADRSEAELRKLSDADLKAAAYATMAERRKGRQF